MPFANLALTDAAIEKGYITKETAFDFAHLNRAVIKVPDYKRIYRLRLMFAGGVRWPRLIPLITWLCRLPLGPVAAVLFMISDALSYYIRNRHNLTYLFANYFNLRKLYRSYFSE